MFSLSRLVFLVRWSGFLFFLYLFGLSSSKNRTGHHQKKGS